MTLNTSKVNADGVSLEDKLFDDIRASATGSQLFLGLTQDVSDWFDVGTVSAEIFQWQLATGIRDTPEDGNDIVGGEQPIQSIIVPCDQDKTLPFYAYDKAVSRSKADFEVGFFSTSPVSMAEYIEGYVASLLRAHGEEHHMTGSTNGNPNSRLTKADLYALAAKFDDYKLPKAGRRLVLSSSNIQSLVEEFNLANVGVAGGDGELRNLLLTRLLGFDIYDGSQNEALGDHAGIAFMADAAMWCLASGSVQVARERQESKARTYMGLRAVFGAKFNDLQDAYGRSVSRAFHIVGGSSSDS